MSDDTELRTPLTDPVRPRHFGAIRVTGRMEIRDLANRKIRDITANVLDARVTVKWLDDIKYRLTCTVDGDADEEIDALHECLAPFLVVHWRDHEGILRTAQGQLGLYIVPPSPVRHSRGAAQAQIDATDVLWGLGTLTARKQTSLTIGTYAGAAAASLLYGQTKIRMSLPTTNEKLVTQRVVKPSENLLAVANEVYTGAGYYELYPTRTGVVTSAPLPEAISKAPVARSIDSRLGDVYEDVDITPDTSRFCNQVFIKSTDPKAGQEMRAGYRITNTDPDSYGSTINTGFVYAKEVADDTDASFDTMKRRARQMLERGSSLDANLAIDVPPDPRFDAHEVWNLHVVRDDGVRVATGQWIVREMEFGLAGNRAGTQRVTLQRRFMLEDLA